MKKTISYIVTLILGGGIMFGGTELMQDPQVVDATADKQAILKEYIAAKVRLNEIPDLNTDIVTPEEYFAASYELASDKEALTKENMFEALHDKAVEDGLACK